MNEAFGLEKLLEAGLVLQDGLLLFHAMRIEVF